MLQIEGLIKEYRRGVRSNDNISLSVEAGEVFGILGHNGAGKTTLVNQIIGLVKPTAGRIFLAGKDVVLSPDFARRVCSVQPQGHVPITGITPREAVELVGCIRGGDRKHIRRRAQDLFEALELDPWINRRGEKLSGGIRRLVAFCMAAVKPGKLVILDEPSNDVDPVRRRLLWQQVRNLANTGCAVMLVTHNVIEAERVVDRLAIMDRARIVASGTPSSLKAHLSGDFRLEIVLEPGVPMPESPSFVRATVIAGRRLVMTVSSSSIGEAITWAESLSKQNITEEFSLGISTLEDVYLHMLGSAGDSVITEE
ncbi:MAG: ABC transporter ATP-binding protein [Nostoc sp. LLA-1]|nr:ABC transporter ATP-binding protein [Cyanocohniella sp. LLY]